jgi:DNA anti-recombination protein RmuC
MVWILAVIVVGLIAVLAEMVLVYQRRAYDLRVKQEPLRRRMRRHQKEMQEAVERVRAAAAQALTEYERDLAERTGALEPRRKLFVELEEQVRAEYHDSEAVGPAADGQDPDTPATASPDALDPYSLSDRGTELRDMTHTVQSKLDELDNHLASLRRDMDIARRMLDRVENRVGKPAPGAPTEPASKPAE